MEANILVVDDEPEIADLVQVYLKSEGFTVFSCLNFYGLSDQLKVGTVSNMYDIVTRMGKAAKVISL